jgi:hypothetical protein
MLLQKGRQRAMREDNERIKAACWFESNRRNARKSTGTGLATEEGPTQSYVRGRDRRQIDLMQ